MKVDDAFFREVESHIVPQGGRSYIGDIIAATLAVAAERGMVVPEGAQTCKAVKEANGRLRPNENVAFTGRGETVVRVAIVEIKE